MIRRLLIANRGEIARRIARTCRRLGIDYVAVHSEADAGAPHLEGAAAIVCIGPAPSAHSYLDIDRLIAAARDTGCDAVHPGYGFLSENPAFARAVTAAGLTFVGPDADTIAAMGDKSTAKALMAEAGVPTVPGSAHATDDPAAVAALTREVGLPALLKPAAGGGGKGMQVIERWEELEPAIESGIRLARTSFGDGRLLVERFIDRPRHIEVQVFGDGHGNVVHLFERECSLQRRHQKIVEEAPAPNLSESVRAELLAAAVRGARAIGYRNAGTFEFILDGAGRFYFLEVNTRLQVEHPVTEEITGLDLVEWQLRIAAGERLPLSQEQIGAAGHSIECRIYAEDPDDTFRPAPGTALRVWWPPGLRVESAIDSGSSVPPHYDPMVAKLIARGADRAEALGRMRAGLATSRILGLTTNIGFLAALLADPRVAEGRVDTRYVDAELPRFLSAKGKSAAMAVATAAWGTAGLPSAPAAASPWASDAVTGALDRIQLDPDAPFGRLALRCGDDWCVGRLVGVAAGRMRVGVDGREHLVELARQDDGSWAGHVDDVPCAALSQAEAVETLVGGRRRRLERGQDADAVPGGGRAAVAPMPGVVVAVRVAAGDHVGKGTVMAVVEAMKMENPVLAPQDGVVAEVLVRPGDSVTAQQRLVVLHSEA